MIKNTKNIAVIGAGAAGLMAAIEAGKKGHTVRVYDHAKKPGEKIRISGGGRCNFTNLHTTHENFIGNNKHFHKSALSRYPSSTFISIVEKHNITYHEKHPEKETGQLFCDGKSQQIIDMLLEECAQSNVQIPKMGASDFGYKIAKQFGHNIIPTEPALVPLTFTDEILNLTKSLSGVAIDSVLVKSDSYQFDDDLLFTHRGLSGPAILQISSYWSAGESLKVNFLSKQDMFDILKTARGDPEKLS